MKDHDVRILSPPIGLELSPGHTARATLDPRKFTKKEVDALVSWTDTKSTGYAAKLWTAFEDFRLYNDNDVVKRLEAKSLWRRPDPAYAPGPVKDGHWLRDALSKLDALDG